jgi:UDP-N-acetylmuramate--alanine ligase
MADKLEGREINLRLPGVHNIENALAALVAAIQAGVDPEVALKAVEEFGGTRRRFELRNEEPLCIGGVSKDVLLVDDYAHHPTAIARTLSAARQRYPGRRVVAVYQPHMFSRTKTFFEQFLTAFDAADEVIIADIYPGRERDTGLIHARDLVAALQERPFTRAGVPIRHGGSVRETARILRETLRSGDLAVIMGAGDVYQITEALLAER